MFYRGIHARVSGLPRGFIGSGLLPAGHMSSKLVRMLSDGSIPIDNRLNAHSIDFPPQLIDTENKSHPELEPSYIESTQSEPEKLSETTSIPWYLRDDIASTPATKQEVVLPIIPSDSPHQLSVFLKYLATDLGITDLQLFNVFDENAYASYKYMIVGTGKSEKHVYKAANELRMWIKKEFNQVPRLEGYVSSAMRSRHRRRMLRRARKGPMATDREYDTPANSWVMCDPEIEGICIHILTDNRRQELDLESLFLGTEETPSNSNDDRPRYSKRADTSHFFSGVRRLHTSRQLYTPVSLYRKFLGEASDLTVDQIMPYIQTSSETKPLSLEEYQLKYSLLRAIHLLQPDLVLFDSVELALLAKYCLPLFMLSFKDNLAKVKSNDVTEYVRLLIDSPELAGSLWEDDIKFTGLESRRHISDFYFDKLSKFLGKVYRFSDDELELNDSLVPLLMRLAIFQEPGSAGELIGARHVDEVISLGVFPRNGPIQDGISVNSDRLRGLVDILNHYKCLPSKELVLYVLGSSDTEQGQRMFWKFWEDEFAFFARDDPKIWIRFVVYLGLRNNQEMLQHFFAKVWGPGNGNAFVDNIKVENLKTNERVILREALQTMVGQQEDFGGLQRVREFVVATLR